VTADQVRDMLGLADRGRIRRLLQLVLSGDVSAALAELDESHDLGIDPTQLLRGLMESLHAATRAKAGAAVDALQSAEERDSAAEMAGALSWGTIHRLWQMLLKGLQDVEIAPDPREAAEMALLRLIHAADMPDPAALMARLSGEGAGSAGSSAPAAAAAGPTARVPADFVALVKAVEQSGKHLLAQQLHDQVGLVRYAPPELVLKPMRPLGGDWPRDLALALKAATGTSWQVSLSDEAGEPSLLEREKMAEERVRADVLADPNVRAVMDAFPDAELESFSTRGV
jgi:DNA polymerase-3 subunit gamma/tau